MSTLAAHIIRFNKALHFTGRLPEGIRIMNPFRENEHALEVSSAFYRRYYDDHHKRHLILGINPGRFGAGVTGVPFTDPKRLESECGIHYPGRHTHEPSSVFVYDMIRAYGGPGKFYRNFFIHSICPLGFTALKPGNKEVNYNYYDSEALTRAVYGFITQSIEQQLKFGLHTELCFCFGKGKNEKFLRKLNKEKGYFGDIIALEHPRYIMQYKSAQEELYIGKYLEAFQRAV